MLQTGSLIFVVLWFSWFSQFSWFSRFFWFLWFSSDQFSWFSGSGFRGDVWLPGSFSRAPDGASFTRNKTYKKEKN